MKQLFNLSILFVSEWLVPKVLFPYVIISLNDHINQSSLFHLYYPTEQVYNVDKIYDMYSFIWEIFEITYNKMQT